MTQRPLMISVTILLVTGCLFFSGCIEQKVSSPTSAQVDEMIQEDPWRMAMFIDLEEMIKKAEAMEAGRFAPDSFHRAMALYYKAREVVARDQDIEKARQMIADSELLLKRSMAIAEVGAELFKETLDARKKAQAAGAAQLAAEQWKSAELQFGEAARALDRGNDLEAKNLAKSAEQDYFMAEVTAVKWSYLQDAWSALKRASELHVRRYAPQTLEKANDLVAQVEDLLKRDRHNHDRLQRLASQATYEANHAIALAKTIQQLKAQNASMEEILLTAEQPLKRISEKLGSSPRLDLGMESATRFLLAEIDQMKTGHDDCLATLKQKDEQIARLNDIKEEKLSEMGQKDAELFKLQQKLTEINRQLEDLKSAESRLKRILQDRKKRQQRLATIKTLFHKRQAQIEQTDDGNLILRLIGLNFATGSAEIQPRHFKLLGKVCKALELFHNCRVVVEGHTDSQGSETDNMDLSMARAQAVRQYLVENSPLTENDVEAVGYGESRPIADNATAAGRKKNRRIDIVIQPVY